MSGISRRRFLQRGGQAAAAAALMTGLPRTLWADPLGLPIGIQLYTVQDAVAKNVPGTLKRLRAMGYHEVEAFHYAGYNARTLRAAVDAAGLKCPSVHLDLNTPELGPAFEEAHVLGAHYAVSPNLRLLEAGQAGETSRPAVSLNDYKLLAKRMNDIARQAKQAGLQYAYHNHDMEFRDLGGGKIGYDILLKETDPALVKFELDCGWMAVAGYNPIHYFKSYPGRYRMLHIKQFVKGSRRTTSTSGPMRPQGTELGRGEPGYKPIFAAARNIGIAHYFVEQEPPFLDMSSMRAAKVDYEYLHALS